MSLAGTIGAMSLGCSVGDIMAISGLAVKVYTAYKDAPGDYRNISDEVKSLHIIINKAAKHFKGTTLSDDDRQEGLEVLRGCQNVLEDLDALIIKYNSLASGSASTSQVIQRFKLGAEDIATLRARLTSNTTLLNGFIQRFDIHTITIRHIMLISSHSCDSDKMQARLDNVLGLRRTMSRDSIVSFAGSINTKKAYKKFCKGLFEIGVTAEIIRQKEKEIQDMLKPQNPATSNQRDDSTFVDPNQLLGVGATSDAETSDTEISPISAATMSTETPRSRSRFGWARPPIDFLVGPLMLSAAEAGNTKRFISTLEYVRNIDFANNQKATALHFAAHGGHGDIVQLLLTKGASIEAMHIKNWTPLHCAAGNGHAGVVEVLLGKSASVDAMDSRNWTPLHLAAQNGHAGVVEILLERGASIDSAIQSGHTPLHLAAQDGHGGVVKVLLKNGAPIDAIQKDSFTPLHLAALNGHVGIAEVLLKNSASVDAINKDNFTPLHLAAQNGHAGVVEILLKNGASIDDAIQEANYTPLHIAAYNGHVGVVEILLKNGASINAIQKDNFTPLHIAAQKGHADVIKLLLGQGASIEALTIFNETPLQVAARNHRTDIVKLLNSKATKAAVHSNRA